MKIYFRSTRNDKTLINKIESVLKKHTIEIGNISSKDNVLSNDLLLVEASIPNAQIGYEVSHALESGIPTIVLYNEEPKNTPVLPLTTSKHKTKLIARGYSNNLEKVLSEAVTEIQNYIDTRFTMNLTPQISNFLNWISDNKKVKRSDYIRSLIESALKKNTEYKAFLKKKP